MSFYEMAARIRTLAERMPGFISFKTFQAQDGERGSVNEFESEETLRAWREHPEHRKAQELVSYHLLRRVPDSGMLGPRAIWFQVARSLNGMNYGFVLPYGDARTAAELAYLAEQSGWDGFFVWEPVWGFDPWVCLTAGAWPSMKSMRRVLHYDGLLPNLLNQDRPGRPMTPADIRAMKAYIDTHRPAATPFDIVMEGTTPGDKPDQARKMVHAWVEAGVTWWIEGMWEALGSPGGLEAVRTRLQQGPPRVQ